MIFQTKSVGIDVRSDSVVIAVAASQGGRMKLLNLIETVIPEADEQEKQGLIASIIRQAFKENGLSGATCAACLPASVSINRPFSTPLVDPAKITQTLKFQIEPQIPYPIDRVISDYITVRKTSDGTDILAIAVTKDPLAERLRVLAEAGVDPQMLTLDALAMADFYMNQFDFSSDKTTALLLADRESSFLGFFIGNALIGYRNLDGISPDNEEEAKRVVKEVARSFVSFQPAAAADAEIGTLCIAGTGVGTLWKVAQESFRDFPVRTVEFNESMLADIPPQFSERAEACRLAIALAHAGLGDSANPINFRREEFSPVSVFSRLKSNIFFSLVVLAVALIAWFGSVLAQIHSQQKQMESLNKQMLDIFGDTLPGIKKPAVAEQKIKEEQEQFKSLKHYSSEYVAPLNILAEVTAGMPDNKSIVMSDLAISDNVLRMTGVADSFDDINSFKDRLEESSLLSAVEIVSATQAKKENKKNFRIRAQIGTNLFSSPAAPAGENP